MILALELRGQGESTSACQLGRHLILVTDEVRYERSQGSGFFARYLVVVLGVRAFIADLVEMVGPVPERWVQGAVPWKSSLQPVPTSVWFFGLIQLY